MMNYRDEPANQLSEESACVLASHLVKRDDVLRVGMVDVMKDLQLWWRFLFVFAKRTTVETYIDLVGLKGTGHSSAIHDEVARSMLMNWSTYAHMEDWLEKNQDDFKTKVTASGLTMELCHWADQLLAFDLLIVPGVGMEADQRFLASQNLWADDGRRMAALIAADIYHAAYEGRHGKNDGAILGPRASVFFFHPPSMSFEPCTPPEAGITPA